jgi:hypothetical protein
VPKIVTGIETQRRHLGDGLVRLANFLEVAGITVWAAVIAATAPIAVMLATVKALVDVTKGKGRRFCATVRAIAKLLVV